MLPERQEAQGRGEEGVLRIPHQDTATSAKVAITAHCGNRLRIRTRIVARAPQASRAVWQRNWKVRNQTCSAAGNG
ncbi:MAG: hypothetical protein KDC39_15290 [Actinobacteria bacterium]|nr:hypothetical protein [Actinomycetota bacterium]